MKVPEPKQLPSGSWFIRMRLGGESIPVTDRSRAECIKTAQLIKAEYLANRQKKPGRNTQRTVGELIDEYIKKYTPVLSASTVRGYETIRRNRFQGVMNLYPAKVTSWQKVINAELGAVSEKTVINAWGLVASSLRDAGCVVPEVKLAAVPESDLPFLEPEEIPLFLDAIRDDPCELEILLELHGLRNSEARKVVKGNQIDLKHGVITVQGAIVRGSEGFAEKKTNKTKKGTRSVQILIPRLEELLKDYKKRGEELPMHGPTMILDHVHKACARAGVTDVSNHGLRRTFASLGYSCGVSERVLMEMGGWKDPTTVHKVYIKLAQRDKTGAVAALRSFYAPPAPAGELGEALEELAALREKYGHLKALEAVFAAAEIAANANENEKGVEK